MSAKHENKGIVKTKLGSKTEPYFKKEKDYLTFPNYTWKSVSKEEKSFYKNNIKNGTFD
jgi:hypothetical protein